ncbi:hypothetical protein TeGR_g8391, partial [Tetraparma gracilis]
PSPPLPSTRYLLRGFTDLMKPYQDKIASAVIALMTTCPPEAVSTRKELLVATRHILATEFRAGFFPYADTLFSSRVLIGEGRLAHSQLRPLGFSTLADLVHHIRQGLTLPQMQRVIHIFSRIIHDSTLPITIQATSVRLLLNLVDHIFHNTAAPSSSRGKFLLVRIMDALVHKVGTIRSYGEVVKARELERRRLEAQAEEGCEKVLRADPPAPASGIPPTSSAPSSPDLLRSSTATPVPAGSLASPPEPAAPPASSAARAPSSPDAPPDSIADVKSLIKTMLLGLKTVIWCVTNYNQDKGSKKAPPSKFSDYEQALVVKYLRWGLRCLDIYKLPRGAGEPEPENPLQPPTQSQLKQ